MTIINLKDDIDWTKQPMFFGEELGFQRSDRFKYSAFNTLSERMLSYYWRPLDKDLTKDKADYATMSDTHKRVFILNLSYQILLDSVQGRAPTRTFSRITSLPELERAFTIWQFFEVIHSDSYSHIIKNLYPNPKEIFDGILEVQPIIARAANIVKYYDKLEACINYLSTKPLSLSDYATIPEIRQALIKALVAVYILEGVRFYVSFACTFALGELKLMEGNAKIVQEIVRDEALHQSITQQIINLMIDKEGYRDDFAHSYKDIVAMFKDAGEEEKRWANYLFKDGSIIGLNAPLLHSYVEWLVNRRAAVVGVEEIYPNAPKSNPLPWMDNWTSSKGVQVAPQETEITSYLISSVKTDTIDVSGMEL